MASIPSPPPIPQETLRERGLLHAVDTAQAAEEFSRLGQQEVFREVAWTPKVCEQTGF